MLLQTALRLLILRICRETIGVSSCFKFSNIYTGAWRDLTARDNIHIVSWIYLRFEYQSDYIINLLYGLVDRVFLHMFKRLLLIMIYLYFAFIGVLFNLGFFGGFSNWRLLLLVRLQRFLLFSLLRRTVIRKDIRSVCSETLFC